MEIRTYRPEDCPLMAQLFYDTVHCVNRKDYTSAQLDAWADGHPDLKDWNRSFLSHHTLVALEGSVLVGFGDMDSSGYLDRLYVHKDYQGRGIASALCRMLENACPARSFSTHASITARPFFEGRGYRVVKAQQVQRKGQRLTNYRMEKEKERSFSAECLRLYAVTDRSWLRPGERLAQRVEAALKGGVTMVQLREKHLAWGELLSLAEELLSLCRRYQVPFILNDEVEAALACGADGVHVGQEDMSYEEARRRLGPGKIIGVSAHNVQEALAAQKAGADYLGCGAVFGSTTKEGVRTLTPEGLKDICGAVNIPVVAIGGVQEQNISLLQGCGASGVAVVSALFAQPDPEEAARRLLQLSRRMVEKC